jgi:hypothetical protein
MPRPTGDGRSDVARHLHGEGVEVETCGAHMESSSVQVAGGHQTDTPSIVPARPRPHPLSTRRTQATLTARNAPVDARLLVVPGDIGARYRPD